MSKPARGSIAIIPTQTGGWRAHRNEGNVMKVSFSSIFGTLFQYHYHYGWQVANKETFLQHSQALRPSWPSQSLWPYQLTQHYQDYDVNYDDRVAYSCSHSIHFPIQCSLLWPALLSLLSFYQHSSISRLTLSGFSVFLSLCKLSSLYNSHYSASHVCTLLYNSISFSIHYLWFSTFTSHSP